MSTQQSDNNLQCTCDPNAIWAVKGFLGHPSCQSCKKKKQKKQELQVQWETLTQIKKESDNKQGYLTPSSGLCVRHAHTYTHQSDTHDRRI